MFAIRKSTIVNRGLLVVGVKNYYKEKSRTYYK